MKRTRIVSVGLVLSALVAVAAPSPCDAQPTTLTLPADVTVAKPLPLVSSFGVPTMLAPGARVRLLSAKGPLFAKGTACSAESGGRTGVVKCDDATFFTIPQPAPSAPSGAPAGGSSGASIAGAKCGGTARVDAVKGLKFCTDVDSCRTFCQCACTFDKRGWKPEGVTDESTKCGPVNMSGPGILPPSSAELKPMPAFSAIKVGPDTRATQGVIDGLTKLDAIAAAAPWKGKYTVFVKSCYRPVEPEMREDCEYILKAAHSLKTYAETPPVTDQQRKNLAWAQKAQDVRNLGRAWPGANPHSAGVGCDIQMLDTRGKALFEWKVTPEQATPKVREASRALDQAVTQAGGKRLTYETWHYEWGGMSPSRCTYPACDAFWPPKGSP